ncbi:TerC/Alx family metal homeostasis membrane protein [Asanoa iriomotensis]|uniref:Tellurium resistance protein TerC n=1 Tax=Asanoa iriomotensis TaxID=234613 RepID=A0ABQ4C8T3_9ACTN|nr:TerC/Alx family metal homeostasis membrane protein [Asanoa iriomotensis]GIF59154.1 tellurium resistance protein TerC [Asanoa iriomotensis]
MGVSALGWVLTTVTLLGLLAVDLLAVSRRKDAITPAGAARWIGLYVGLALVAAVVLFFWLGKETAEQFVATYLTEYSLSADNLFVFMLIIGRFAVPPDAVESVLTVGILLSLGLRTLFIAAGSAAVHAFNWLFYLFGAFLVYTAVRLVLSLRAGEEEEEKPPGIALLSRLIPTTDVYAGRRYTTTIERRRVLTPIPLVIAAIGLANLVFALDSLPAAFGLTQSAFVIVTANAFAMLGLRQLYYVVGGLLERVVYLPVALAVILGFIGVKLVLEALRGSHIAAPEIGVGPSLATIVGVLTIAVVASALRNRQA